MIPFRRHALSLVAALVVAAGVAASGQPSGYSILWDDFSSGFSVAPAAGAKWFYFSAGPFVGNDGAATTSNKGLRVSTPQFSLTLGQEGSIENPYSLPGGLDHVKWLVYANHTASSFFPGFDAVAGQELRFDTWISGESFGNTPNPFGSAVADPDDDVRLATTAMNTIDFETFLVADFFMTNKRIYVVRDSGRPANAQAATASHHRVRPFCQHDPLADRRCGGVSRHATRVPAALARVHDPRSRRR